jgi:hypothetical protein
MTVNPERRLFCYVLAIALRDEDALEGMASRDGKLTCDLAYMAAVYAEEKVRAFSEGPEKL